MGPVGSRDGRVEAGLIALAKRSAQYRAIRQRIARPCPSDTWYENGVAFIAFDLVPVDSVPAADVAWLPQAIFALAAASGDLLAVRVVEPDTDDGYRAVEPLAGRERQGAGEQIGARASFHERGTGRGLK